MEGEQRFGTRSESEWLRAQTIDADRSIVEGGEEGTKGRE